MNTKALTIAALLTATPAWAINVTETVDFSDNGLAPSAFVLDPGLNVIAGDVGFHTSGPLLGQLDFDYFALTVPVGHKLASLVLGPNTNVGGAFSFVGVQAGSVVTVDPNAGTAAGLLGWTHYGPADLGLDILAPMGLARAGATGFTPPLSSGTYTFWVQDFSSTGIVYDFQFTVTAIPEPATTALMLAGLGVVGAAVRRRKRAA